jgi:hypothetical protein
MRLHSLRNILHLHRGSSPTILIQNNAELQLQFMRSEEEI